MQEFTLIATIIGIIVLILWVFLPFAVFGTKPKIDELIVEAKETNRLLGEIIKLLSTKS
jgi:ABC-type sulfate transport system permease component